MLLGLIGEKLGHSLSPMIHAMILSELRLKGYYHLFEVKRQELQELIIGLKLVSHGVNVTIPYKEKVIPFLDDMSPEAKKIGAVNTISFCNRLSVGYNTDYDGFGKLLSINNIDIIGKRALILGSGGAAKAVACYFADNRIGEIIVVSRTEKRRDDGFKGIKFISYREIDKLQEMEMVVNCTPCGMYPNVEDSPLTGSQIQKFQTAIDLIYNPYKTSFLKIAQKCGLTTINGLYMLVGQAVKAQELWQSRIIGQGIVEKIYNACLNIKMPLGD